MSFCSWKADLSMALSKKHSLFVSYNALTLFLSSQVKESLKTTRFRKRYKIHGHVHN
jgi:hypothetical protein